MVKSFEMESRQEYFRRDRSGCVLLRGRCWPLGLSLTAQTECETRRQTSQDQPSHVGESDCQRSPHLAIDLHCVGAGGFLSSRVFERRLFIKRFLKHWLPV